MFCSLEELLQGQQFEQVGLVLGPVRRSLHRSQVV